MRGPGAMLRGFAAQSRLGCIEYRQWGVELGSFSLPPKHEVQL